MTYIRNRESGFIIKLILIIIALVLVLSFFGVDIKSAAESPQTQKNIAYVVGIGKSVWDKYLSKPILYFWQNIFIDLLWESFVSNMKRIKQGEPTDLQLMAPFVPIQDTFPAEEVFDTGPYFSSWSLKV